MSIQLNSKITIISKKAIINTKAEEKYLEVQFDYGKSSWTGYIPIAYRRTNLDISFDDKDALHSYLNDLYSPLDPQNYQKWRSEQEIFWNSKPKAEVTKSFFDALAGGVWKCSACQMPVNNNPQRRIQDLKEFGYTISTTLSMFCTKCKTTNSHRMLLPIPRFISAGNGYETIPPNLRKRIIKLFSQIDAYEHKKNSNCLPDHKFPEIRWDDSTKSVNSKDMSDEEIIQKFQLLTNQRNQQKREICRNCKQTGKRGEIFGIDFYPTGSSMWDKKIPTVGKEAEKGCAGCPWYDIQKWRTELNKFIKHS